MCSTELSGQVTSLWISAGQFTTAEIPPNSGVPPGDHEAVALDDVQNSRQDSWSAARFVKAVYGGDPFLGRVALDSGVVTRHDLGTRFRRVHPRVFVARSARLSTLQKIRAAWLWAGSDSVVCGGAAAFLCGEKYLGEEIVDDDEVHLWMPRYRTPPPGIVVHRWTSAPESVLMRGMAVTTPARTAIDLARLLDSDVRAVAALDSMCRTGGTSPEAVARTAFQMSGRTGVRRVVELLPAVDPGAESPKETELRLVMAASELPRFETQVKVADDHGRIISRLDLGNRRWKVGLHYDGEDHLRRDQRDRDSLQSAQLAAVGWVAPRVTQGMLRMPETLVGFARDAFLRQGWTP